MKQHRALSGWSISAIVCMLVVNPAMAGMPSFQLRDLVAARLESISFFIVVFLLATLVLKMAWNYLQRTFTRIPRLGYLSALGITLATGLFFAVVLTMISGARELMTPGAWDRVGSLYQLKDPKHDPDQWLNSARVKALERLRIELWKYAEAHKGYFPTSRFEAEIAEQVWQGIAPDNSMFGYWGGLKADKGQAIVAYESNVYGPERFVLRTDGEIAKMKAAALSRELENQMNMIYTSKTANDGR